MNNYTEKRKYKRIELGKKKYKEIVTPCIARFRSQTMECPREIPFLLNGTIVAVKNLSCGRNYF